ncbi:hypothetical protein E0Z10_g170 [Xylaria hypoxylon]|uniref:2EXR domain-containing protein n=1 Tax=Xylaria hypoxylon TaxID=37992 RepID=A0A4Z0ZC38_9PEZI|nr:hypothetical protein E0Z10_g170 [Xylaria hypoxylon]
MPARWRQQQRKQMFHLFGQLPTELRLEIWAQTWEPRSLSIYPIDDDHFLCPGGRNRLPASAYVNSESRSETLRHYKRRLAHRDKTDFRWFNFHLDTLCLGGDSWFLDKLDPRDLRQLQRLIVPEALLGAIRAATHCHDTWPEPVTRSFESPMVKERLEEKYPSLREIAFATTGKWFPPYVPDDIRENCYLFEPRYGPCKAWGHMKTTYIAGIRVRHSHCCRLIEEEVEFLSDAIIKLLV